MVTKLKGALAEKPKKPKKVEAAKSDAAPVHLPDGEFDIPRKDGDAPRSEMTVEDLHPVAIDEALEKKDLQEWVEPYPADGLVHVEFVVGSRVGKDWVEAGVTRIIPAELAHSLAKQIKKVEVKE